MTKDTTPSRPPVSRRVFLSATLGLAAVGATRKVAGRPVVRSPSLQTSGLRPISMAMHIHGSFSEGTASYEAHLQQARQHGVDVIWWTDHDFRVAAHHHRRAVRFDGFKELEDGLEWTWTEEREGDVADGAATFVAEPRSRDEPGHAMRLHGRGGNGQGLLASRATAWNWTYSVSMADTTLELDVLAEDTGPGREVVLQIESSYHPARHGRPAGQYHLEYRIGGHDAVRHHHDGLRGLVDLPAARGEWHRLRLRPVADIQRIWPDLVAEDNSLHQLRIGVRVAPGAETRAVVDRLRFDRGRGQGASGIELRRSVLARYAQAYPDVVHFEAFEVSLVRHLNWIGGSLTLPPLVSPPFRNNDPELAEKMIAFVHRHGGLAQWNHPLDNDTPESLVRLMIDRDNLGADLVEIGRPPFDDLRQVFDGAARNAVFFTGVGVSDDHAGRDWVEQSRNRLTYVWAASTSMDDLTGALRAGRAWWVDPARWRGSLGMLVEGTHALGGVLLTDARDVRVDLVATDVPAGGSLVILESPVDYAGPSPSVTTRRVPGDRLQSGRHAHVVEPGTGRYLRLQVLDEAGAIIGESNPLWMLREPPARGIPDARRLGPGNG